MELYGRQWKGDRVTLWLSKKYLMHFRMQQMHRFGKIKNKSFAFFCSEENLKLIIIFMEFFNIKLLASFHLTLVLWPILVQIYSN
jgi:hypothetical protein